MRLAVARHYTLLQEAVRNNNGRVLKTTGDGIAAVFTLAFDALAAAVAAQQALLAEPWPEQTPLRSRMAIHTGAAELRDGDYFGTAVNRCGRLMAAEALEQYLDGVWLVELAPLGKPELVPQTIASAVSIKEQAGQPISQTLTSALKDKRMLVLLDNCEHLLSACAQIVATLIRDSPNITVLAKSREALRIGGEHVFRCPSLSLPAPKAIQAATAENLSQFGAVRLFIERAQAIRSEFSVTNRNAPALAQICFRLDGIPLAIELATACISTLTVEQINDKLDSRFRRLTGGDRSALIRHLTLRALIDWSYDLLTESEKVFFARLSVFAGGWTLRAAEAVCGWEPI